MKARKVGRRKCVSSLPAYSRRAEGQQELAAVVAELVDGVAFGVHDPHVLLRIVRADLDVVRPHPHLVPLRPAFDDLAARVDRDHAVLPAPVLPRCARPRTVQFVPVRDGVAGLPQRQPEHGKFQAGSYLRQLDRLRTRREERQHALLHQEHAVRALGEHVHRLRPGPVLVGGQALADGPRPVRDRVVRPEDVLSTLLARDCREPGARHLLRL